MIIWLASYPKSGNTWVRLFLDNLFSDVDDFNINNNLIDQFPLRQHFEGISNNINDLDEFAKNCVAAQSKLNIDKKIKILKTHNAFWNWKNGKHYFTDQINTLGVIYIVRDPRNIITSVLNYFHKNNYTDALKFMTDNKVLGGHDGETGLPTIIGSWQNHYKSWKKFKKNVLLIKYENLLKNPDYEFLKITDFLNKVGRYNFDNKKIIKAINDCEFKNLKKQEDLYGFKGNSETNKKLNQKFFNLGPKNRWENILEEKIIKEIELLFQKEMKELGYI